MVPRFAPGVREHATHASGRRDTAAAGIDGRGDQQHHDEEADEAGDYLQPVEPESVLHDGYVNASATTSATRSRPRSTATEARAGVRDIRAPRESHSARRRSPWASGDDVVDGDRSQNPIDEAAEGKGR